MKIVILNGSPRNKNTACLSKAFIEGAAAAGHEATEYKVAKMKIAPCVACEFCHGKGEGVCAIKDEWVEVRAAIEASDMVVFASPIYYFALTGQIQTAISRLYAAPVDAVKKAALIMSSASPNVYDGAKAQYRDMLGWFKAEDKGVFSYMGDVAEGDAAYEEIKKFAASL